MNVLLLTLLDFESIEERWIYTDLLREFVKNGHYVYSVSPIEKRTGKEERVLVEQGSTILKLKIGNVTKASNVIEKGISTLQIESQFIRGIKQYFSNIKFDLVLYSTPPITFAKVIRFIKNRDQAVTYLMLKDIFPQNAVDLGILSKTGWKSILYKVFRQKEKTLYGLSDYIGCMSDANVSYVLSNNAEIDKAKVGVLANSVDIIDKSVDEDTRKAIREKYDIPLDKLVFVYGGNLGKPQGIPFLLKCLKEQRLEEKIFFLIVGDGTEYPLVDDYIKNQKPENVKLIKRLPKEDYDTMVAACDVGMIFLDYRFTIPNFPSRILSYMQAKLPVLAVTDKSTDIGSTIVDGGFGWWCESNDEKKVCELLNNIVKDNFSNMGEVGFAYLKEHYDCKKSYESIIKQYKVKERA